MTMVVNSPGSKSLLLLCLGALAGSAHAAGTAARDCAALAGLDLADAGVTITAAEVVPAAAPGTVRINPYSPPLAVGLPAYCKVSGVIDQRTGAQGRPYGIGFELALPEDWNGRFLFQGGGGMNGSIAPPLGATAAGDVPALARGFAVVSNDSGHKGEGFDATFMGDQRAALDFAHASVGTVTAVSKRIVAARYGRSPAHSYIAGCSTGGREAMLAIQRYPEMFDGAVVGAPAMRTGFSNLGLAHARAAFARAAPRGAEGRPQLARTYSAADKALILKELLAQCDDLDGLSDGIIENTGACRFQPGKLQCARGGKGEGCLDAAQVQALTEAFQGPKDAAGAPLYADFPYDTGIVFEGMGIPGFLPGAGPDILAGVMPAGGQEIDAMARKVRADAVQILTDTNVWTNLSTFLQRGGKVAFFHGVSDPWFSAWDTLDYVQRAGQANGEAQWSQASRFYLVPGMGHCGGGTAYDRFDLLGAVVNWVEGGTAPAAVSASRSGPAAATRPLCPYPAYARYRGQGDPASAESFVCSNGD